jgi:hypothetical protein
MITLKLHSFSFNSNELQSVCLNVAGHETKEQSLVQCIVSIM